MDLTGDQPKVYWYGPVDKIGSNLAALPRVLFVTPNALLVCQPTGGVTRTIAVDNVVEVSLSPPAVVRFIVAKEPDLVVSCQSPDDRQQLLQGVVQAFHETCGEGSELPVTETAHLQVTPSASPIPTTSVPDLKNSPKYANFPSFTSNVFPSSRSDLSLKSEVAPSSKLDFSALDLRGSPQEGNTAGIRQPNNGANRHTASPLREESIVTSSISGAQLYPGHAAHFASSSPPPQSTITSLQMQIESQQRIIEQLQRDQTAGVTVSNLRKELEQSKNLISDLQVALRSQEGAFSEMLKANEALKVSETIRSNLEAQVSALKDEVLSLKNERVKRDAADEDWKRRFSQQEEGHKNEIQSVRDAFAKYDEQVTTYVDQLKRDHDRALQELAQHKDALLVRQGELQSKIEQLEVEKRNAVAQRVAITGAVWRPQGTKSPTAAGREDMSFELNGDELRAALMTKLNRFSKPSNGGAAYATAVANAANSPPPMLQAQTLFPQSPSLNYASQQKHQHVNPNNMMQTPTAEGRRTPIRRHISPTTGKPRDRSIL